MEGMKVSISWTADQMEAVLAALSEGAEPQLDRSIASRIRALGEPSPLTGDADPSWLLELDFHDAQRLKAWCDARRERETDAGTLALWTRIVAKVNEGVQFTAAAKE
jgi:hypothetical protein